MMVNSCICTCSERICLNRTTLPRRVYQRQLIFDPCGAHSTVRTTSNKSKLFVSNFLPLLDWPIINVSIWETALLPLP